MDEAYLHAMRQHLDACRVDLEQLHAINTQGEMTRFHIKATERTLQVLIESCIGLVKHWVKLKTQHTPTEAYQAFARLAEIRGGVDLQQWKSIIGMRNVLVHDYLQVNPEVVLQLLQEKRYELRLELADEALLVLAE